MLSIQYHIFIGTVAIRRKSAALDDLYEVFHLLGGHTGRVMTQNNGEHFLKIVNIFINEILEVFQLNSLY